MQHNRQNRNNSTGFDQEKLTQLITKLAEKNLEPIETKLLGSKLIVVVREEFHDKSQFERTMEKTGHLLETYPFSAVVSESTFGKMGSPEEKQLALRKESIRLGGLTKKERLVEDVMGSENSVHLPKQAYEVHQEGGGRDWRQATDLTSREIECIGVEGHENAYLALGALKKIYYVTAQILKALHQSPQSYQPVIRKRMTRDKKKVKIRDVKVAKTYHEFRRSIEFYNETFGAELGPLPRPPLSPKNGESLLVIDAHAAPALQEIMKSIPNLMYSLGDLRNQEIAKNIDSMLSAQHDAMILQTGTKHVEKDPNFDSYRPLQEFWKATGVSYIVLK